MLEIGSDLGGASRYFAAERGCDRWARAPEPPFEDGGFDVVYMMHVGMNVCDKASLFRECRRGLAPGGAIGVCDIMREQAGESEIIARAV